MLMVAGGNGCTGNRRPGGATATAPANVEFGAAAIAHPDGAIIMIPGLAFDAAAAFHAQQLHAHSAGGGAHGFAVIPAFAGDFAPLLGGSRRGGQGERDAGTQRSE